MKFELETLKIYAIDYGLKGIYALIILLVGLQLTSFLTKKFRKLLVKRDVDASLIPFLSSSVNAILKVCLVLVIMSQLGIEATSFAAILASVGLAVGMALSGTLQNFAGGVLILILRPFKVGDVIEAQGFIGSVNEIQIFYTVLKTPDNKHILIPNGPLSTGSLINYSAEATRRLDMTFGIGYNDSIDAARAVIKNLIENDTRVLKDPAYNIFVSELGDNSVNFSVRMWVNAADYWPLHFDMQERVKKEFDANNISIPFPQRDVHVYNH